MRLTAIGEQRIRLVATTGSNLAAVTVPVVDLEVDRVAERVLAIARAAEQVLAIARAVVRAQVIVRVGVRAQVIVRVGVRAQVIVRVVVRAQVIVRVVVRAQLIVRVAVALGIVPVPAELATDQPHGHLAVLARTKSVTAARRLDLVPLLEAEEDWAAAVAETTHEPVAAEAVIAWAAAE